ATGKSNGGKFVLVKFTAKNLGNVASSLKNIAVLLTDSKSRNYSPVGVTDRVTFQIEGYEQFNEYDFEPSVVKPGIVKKLFILAEVATDSDGLRAIIANQ